MASNLDYVIVVTANSFRDHIVRGNVLGLGAQVDNNFCTILELCEESFALAQGDAASGDVGGCGVLEKREGVAFKVSVTVVIGNDAEGAFCGGEAYFNAEGADAAVDEGNFAYKAFGEVRLDELLACVIVRLGLDLDSEIK